MLYMGRIKYANEMILQNFEQFPKGLDWKYYCYGFKAAIVQINLMILGRSASKRLSEPGRYKVHSYNLFMRKFWILSLLNAHRSCRNVCFKYIKKSKFRVICSTTLKLNRIYRDTISTLSLIKREVISFMKIL